MSEALPEYRSAVELADLIRRRALSPVEVVETALARIAQVDPALGAFAFSGYLLFVQLALIEAVCDWCVVNDAIVTALVPFALLRLRR